MRKRISLKTWIITFNIIIIFIPNNNYCQDYIWPTDASKYVTSSFCEYRDYHFHSGIDIKTWSMTGYKVFSIDNGSLWRLKVSPFGYGKVLYIRHNDGKFSVYGHLLRFSEKIQKLAKNEQKRQKRFEVEMFFKDDEVPIEKGELIAYTGRSGTVSPHLHFEIRDSYQNPLNPNIYGFKVSDKFSPIVNSVSITPLDYNSLVNNDYKPCIIPIRKISNGKYTLSKKVDVWGNIGVGISTYDMDGNVGNKLDPYSIEFHIDNKEIFKVKYDKFSFDETRDIVVDKDFRLIKRDYGVYSKLYRDIGNYLSFYKDYNIYDGVVCALPVNKGGLGEGEHPFDIFIGDPYGNVTVCSGLLNIKPLEETEQFVSSTIDENDYYEFGNGEILKEKLLVDVDLYDNYIRLVLNSKENIKSNPEIDVYNNRMMVTRIKSRKINHNKYVCSYQLVGDEIKNLRFVAKSKLITGDDIAGESEIKLFPVNKSGGRIFSEDGNCIIEFPENSLFKKFWGRITENNEINSKNLTADKIYSLEPFDIPLRNRIKLFVKYPNESLNPEKFGIYSVNGNGYVYSKSMVNNTLSYISSNIGELGKYALIKDIVPPVIYKVIPGNGANIRNRRPEITVYFGDKLSGIGDEENYTLRLDGEKLICEYDLFLSKVFHTPEKSLSLGEHIIEFKVKDNMNNESYIKSTFRIIK